MLRIWRRKHTTLQGLQCYCFWEELQQQLFPYYLFTSLIFMSSLFVTVRNLLVGSSHFLIEKLYLPIDHGEC